MKWLALIFIVVPVLEIGILLWSGNTFGLIPTIIIILTTGILGAYLAKKQGLKAIRDIQEGINNFQAPAEQLLNAAFVLVGGVLLLTPGFISDALGFSLLFSPTQKLYKPLVYHLIQKKMKTTRVIVR